jgi:hypothetical protein
MPWAISKTQPQKGAKKNLNLSMQTPVKGESEAMRGESFRLRTETFSADTSRYSAPEMKIRFDGGYCFRSEVPTLAAWNVRDRFALFLLQLSCVSIA